MIEFYRFLCVHLRTRMDAHVETQNLTSLHRPNLDAHDYRIGRATGYDNRVTPDCSLYIDHYSLKSSPHFQ